MNHQEQIDAEILVVDDDPGLADTLTDFLQHEGYTVATAVAAADALEIQRRSPRLALAIVDLMMPVTDGLALMEELHRVAPSLPVLIMTGYGTIETAVDAIKRGAEDYLTKPFDQQAIRKKVGRLMEVRRLRDQVAQLEANLHQISDPFHDLIYVSGAMQKVIERARAASTSDTSLLILGETGTGKEMLARAVHRASRRASAAFLPINCGAIPRELVESELFGVRRGAFTGAYQDAPGIFVAAKGGTVFLDEIGEMPREAQVKLLRVLQERQVRPLGQAAPVAVDVRVIAATNRSLAALRSEVLREDLYFRLATVVVEIPPLRARREDIIVLAQSFAARLADRYGRHITISPSATELLVNYGFPGNVRELENLLESVTALSQQDPQTITERDLKPLLVPVHNHSSANQSADPLQLEEVEHRAIERAIRVCGGNRTRAAALLGISRDTLYRKMKELKAEPERGK